MHVIGYNAKLLRDQEGNNMDYYTNSITLGGGESLDVILDASNTAVYPKGQIFYLYTPQLDHLSNDQENFGGLMTKSTSTRRAMMMPMMMKIAFLKTRLLLPVMVAVASLAATAHAAAPGITGPTFNLTAQPAYLNQPDGSTVYSWGYGCNGAPSGFAPAAITDATCPTMQVPGPTLIVTEGETVTVNLTNNLPTPAGNTSILFPGFKVTTTGGVTGLMTQEAAPGGTVTYTFIAATARNALLLQRHAGRPADRDGPVRGDHRAAGKRAGGLHDRFARLERASRRSSLGRSRFPTRRGSLRSSRHLLRPRISLPVLRDGSEHPRPGVGTGHCDPKQRHCTAATAPGCSLEVPTEPYHPAYFLINGRSMPDDMDPNYDTPYPHQPYNGNPHMHPGEQVLLRIIGQGRWQHPFHEHANHVRILARDGNLILTPDGDGDWQALRCLPPRPRPARPWMESSTSPAEA